MEKEDLEQRSPRVSQPETLSISAPRSLTPRSAGPTVEAVQLTRELEALRAARDEAAAQNAMLENLVFGGAAQARHQEAAAQQAIL